MRCGAARADELSMSFWLKCVSAQPIRNVCLWDGFNCNWCNLSEPPTRVRSAADRRNRRRVVMRMRAFVCVICSGIQNKHIYTLRIQSHPIIEFMRAHG